MSHKLAEFLSQDTSKRALACSLPLERGSVDIRQVELNMDVTNKTNDDIKHKKPLRTVVIFHTYINQHQPSLLIPSVLKQNSNICILLCRTALICSIVYSGRYTRLSRGRTGFNVSLRKVPTSFPNN